MSILLSYVSTIYQRMGKRLPVPIQRSIAIVQERIDDPAPEVYQRQGPEEGQHDALSWCLIITLLNVLGLLCIAYGFTQMRQTGADINLMLFLGLVLLFAPVVARLLLPTTTRNERIYLLCLLGISCYLIKVLTSPLYFSLFDEFLHMRTANDILSSKHLYSENSILPVSAYYPGLEIVTNALSSLSGLDTFYAGTIIIGVARLIMMIALFLLYEQLLRSHRAASIATIVYITNPHFLMFDAEFSYESLALPLTILILVVLIPYQTIAMRLKELKGLIVCQRSCDGIAAENADQRSPQRFRHMSHDRTPVLRNEATEFSVETLKSLKIDLIRIAGVAWFVIVALAFTHHITTYFLDSVLALWALLYVWLRLAPIYKAGLVRTTLFAVGVSLFCILRPGNPIIDYLSSFAGSTVTEFGHILAGNGGARQLFTSYNDHPTPLWQRGLTISSFFIILACLPFGLLCLWRQRTNALVYTFGIIAFLYPFIQVFRFTNTGSEFTDRAAAFLFLPLSYVLALFFTHFWPLQRFRRRDMALITVVLTIMMCGGVVLGAGPQLAVFPGPYEVIADGHSIEEQGIESAQWTHTHLIPNSRVATDRINQILQAVYGEQYIVSDLETRLDVSPIFLEQNFGANDIALLQKAHIRYLVVDMRLTRSKPLLGFYYEQSEVGAYQHLKPIDRQAFEKFRMIHGIETIYDGGDIIIYDMGGITDAAQEHRP